MELAKEIMEQTGRMGIPMAKAAKAARCLAAAIGKQVEIKTPKRTIRHRLRAWWV